MKSQFCFILFLSLQMVFSQISFMNLSQTPLLLSPSNAGGKDVKRIAMVGNHIQGRDFKSNAIYASYDAFLHKKKLGVGCYAYFNKNERSLNFGDLELFKDFFKTEDLNKKLPIIYSLRKIGLCISPKYNIGAKNEIGQHSHTFSPSLELAYSNEMGNSVGSFLKTYNKAVFQDTTVVVQDSLFFGKAKWQSHVVKVNSGFKVSAKKWSLFYSFEFAKEFIKENYELNFGSQLNNAQSKQLFVFRNGIEKITHRIYGMYAYNLKGFPKISIIGLFGVGHINYLYLKNEKNRMFMSEAIKYYKENGPSNYLYASLTLKFGNVISGFSYNYLKAYSAMSLNLGFQNKKYRFMGSFMPASMFVEKPSVVELSSNVFF
jgi:hypothetical protein